MHMHTRVSHSFSINKDSLFSDNRNFFYVCMFINAKTVNVIFRFKPNMLHNKLQHIDTIF